MISGAATITPQAMVSLLSWWMSQPDFTMFRESLPMLGESGDLALFGQTSPAKGKIFARTGTHGGADYVNQQALMTSRAVAGYRQVGDHFLVYNLVFNDAGVPSAGEILSAATDLADISAYL